MNDIAGRIAKAIKCKSEVVKTVYNDLMTTYPIKPINNDEELAVALKVIDVFTSFSRSSLTEDEKDYQKLLLRVIKYYNAQVAHLKEYQGGASVG
jgi:hypothetical protein